MISHTLPDQLSTEVFFCDKEPHEFADELVRILANLGAQRTLVVTGGRAARPWLPGLLKVLEGHCIIAREECRSAEIRKLGEFVETYRIHRYDTIVAIGGGTVIDACKALARATRIGRPLKDLFDVVEPCGVAPHLIAVPTTAGSGSEVTPFATIWDSSAKIKRSLQGSDLIPVAALLNPLFLRSLPHPELMAGFFDAVSHSIDSALSPASTDVSLDYCIRALKLLGQLGVAQDRCFEYQDAYTLWTATLNAAAAIAMTRSGMIHAMSYALTLEQGLAHGKACAAAAPVAVALVETMDAGQCRDARGADHVNATLLSIKQALQVPAEVSLSRWLSEFVGRCQIFDTRIDMFSILASNATKIVLYDRASNSPRRLSAAEFKQVLISYGRGLE